MVIALRGSGSFCSRQTSSINSNSFLLESRIIGKISKNDVKEEIKFGRMLWYVTLLVLIHLFRSLMDLLGGFGRI